MNTTESEVHAALCQTVERFSEFNFDKLDPISQRELNRIVILCDLLSPRSVNNGTDSELELDLAHCMAYGTRRQKPTVSFQAGLKALTKK